MAQEITGSHPEAPVLNGAELKVSKRRDRRNLDCEPPPSHLNADAAKEWQRLVPVLTRADGKLSLTDADALTAYCILHSRCIEAERAIAKDGAVTGAGKVNPWVRVSRDAMIQKTRLATTLGLAIDFVQMSGGN